MLLAGVAPASAADWLDPAWPMRRALDLPARDRAAADESTVVATWFIPSNASKDGADVRVATDVGKVLASRVLRVGPGDAVTVAFNAPRNLRRAYAYFGNPKPGDSKPIPAFTPTGGLLWESVSLVADGPTENPKAVAELWQRGSKQPMGATFVDSAYLGVHPIAEGQRCISRATGSVEVPTDGEYTFAASADDKAAVFVDGKPLLVAHGVAGDARWSAKLDLQRGRHELVVYHVEFGGDTQLTVAWRPPGEKNFVPIPAAAFGATYGASAGPLEELRKPAAADLDVQYLGEAFANNRLSHRVRISGRVAESTGARLKPTFEYDFGDGQQGRGPAAEHVYLAAGEYPIKVTARVGPDRDERTYRIRIDRIYGDNAKAHEEDLATHAMLVATYAIDRLPASHLPQAAVVLGRTGRFEKASEAMRRIVTAQQLDDVDGTLAAIDDVIDRASEAKKVAEIADALAASSEKSPAAAKLARRVTDVLLWRLGDVGRARAVLARLAGDGRDAGVRRRYAIALLLDNQAAEARKVMDTAPGDTVPEAQRVALSGAMARTIEFHAGQKDLDAGEEQWDRWVARFPSVVFDGYAMLLRVRLLETQYPQAAARVAEAFALAVPDTAYSPQLLDRASRLYAKTEKAKSEAVRQLLKQRYPESPEAQD
jgi:hypothetical protein